MAKNSNSSAGSSVATGLLAGVQGMDWVKLALTLLPQLISLGTEVGPLIKQISDVLFGGKVPSEADWIALHATEDMMRRRLNQNPIGA